MNNTFKNILEGTFKDQECWNYYSLKDFTKYPLQSEEESKNFIKSFYQISGKTENSLHSQIDKLGSRVVHVVSAFLLGQYLYKNSNLKSKIDNEISKLKCGLDIKSVINFSYIWFLICLFHDIGYSIEEEQPKYKDYEQLLSETTEMPKIIGIPDFYNMVYKNYFKYRLKEHCKNDHGITVAHLMFKDLCEIRSIAENNPKDGKEKLSWDKDLEKIYAFCSWNVLAHNIWFAVKDNTCDLSNYKKYKIKRLVFDGNYKIKPNKFPFFFLFCIVDTIEPYKKVLDLKMLENIELEIKNDKIIINSNLNCNLGNSILKQAYNLNKWLTYTSFSQNTVEISLNQIPL